MDDQEKREAGRRFGESLRQKLAANRQDLTERLMAGREGQVARRTEESGSPKETRGQGHASEGS